MARTPKIEYAIYNPKDELMYVGTSQECANYLGIKTQSFFVTLVKQRKGLHSALKYTIYKIEDD